MSDISILAQLPLFTDPLLPPKKPEKQPDLHAFWRYPHHLPAWVATSPPVMRTLDLLGPLHWADFPERNLRRDWGYPTIPYAALVAAELVKLNEGLPSLTHLCQFLSEHPGFIWLFGFPWRPALNEPLSLNTRVSLPSQRHLTHLLRTVPNSALQYLLADSIQLILAELNRHGLACSECVSLDTKHIVAWVKENNPKTYVADRYDKDKQPLGDPDCRLGCKRRRNRATLASTPARNPVSASSTKAGEYYWGYGSGIVATQVPGYGEFVLAELTRPFDHGDLSYFAPLMHVAEQRLGHKPRFGAFDAAFDAWYVYTYFSAENQVRDGFAAIPFSEKGGFKVSDRRFAPDGSPLCAAALPMPLQFTYTDRSTCLVEHERGKYVCPIHLGADLRRRCPVHHANWDHGGCTVMMPISIGARLRYTLDRDSAAYKDAYAQRTACERINAQAVALGIERPHLRNGQAIANQNTLIYLLINLRFLQRLRLALANAPVISIAG